MRSSVFDRSGGFFWGVFCIMMFTLTIPATFYNVMNLFLDDETKVSFRIYIHFKVRQSAEPSGGLHHVSKTR